MSLRLVEIRVDVVAARVILSGEQSTHIVGHQVRIFRFLSWNKIIDFYIIQGEACETFRDGAGGDADPGRLAQGLMPS